MKKDYLIVHKSVLPDFIEPVLSAKEAVDVENISVSDACKRFDISRSTYYKYKDKVLRLVKNYGRKAIITFRVEDRTGILSGILNKIAAFEGNVLTINQDMPIHELAFINITIDTKRMSVTLNELVEELGRLSGIKNVELVAFE